MERKAIASAGGQIAPQTEGLSVGPCSDLTANWERLGEMDSRLHSKDLQGETKYLHDLQKVLYSVSTPLEYEFNSDSNRFAKTPEGLKDWIYKTVDGILETIGNEEERDEWRRIVGDHPWRL